MSGVMSVMAIIFTFSRRAVAASRSGGVIIDKQGPIMGWDLFGRVPYDDWLFSTSRLIRPDLLRRSYVEAILQELPEVYSNFQRRKMINDSFMIVKGIFYFSIVVAVCAVFASLASDRIKKDRAREAAIRGFDMPISASFKGSSFKGRSIRGNEGWIDMSRPDRELYDDLDDDDDDNVVDDRGKDEGKNAKKGGGPPKNNKGNKKDDGKKQPDKNDDDDDLDGDDDNNE